MSKLNANPGITSYGYEEPRRNYIVNADTIERVLVRIDPTARDVSNTTNRTTRLQEGLVLGKVTASGYFKEYDNADSDGTQTAVAILDEVVDVLDPNGVALSTPIMANVIIKGFVDADYLRGIDAAGKAELRTAGFLLREDYQP